MPEVSAARSMRLSTARMRSSFALVHAGGSNRVRGEDKLATWGLRRSAWCRVDGDVFACCWGRGVRPPPSFQLTSLSRPIHPYLPASPTSAPLMLTLLSPILLPLYPPTPTVFGGPAEEAAIHTYIPTYK